MPAALPALPESTGCPAERSTAAADSMFAPCDCACVQPRPRADRIGRVLAVLCAVHCAMVPLLLPMAAVLGAAAWGAGAVEQFEALEIWLAASALATASLSLYRHRREPQRLERALWLAVGLALLFLGRPAGGLVGVPEWLASIGAGAFLFVGHSRPTSSNAVAS